jgi:hypothetical protein
MSEYRYIGKDGMPILARDLEDQRDAALAKLEKIKKAWDDVLWLEEEFGSDIKLSFALSLNEILHEGEKENE